MTQQSGTYNFGNVLENDEIIREAWERCGRDGSSMSLVQGQSAIRSMQLLFTEWTNRGINLFDIYQDQIILSVGTPSYTLPVFIARMLQVLTQGPLSAGPNGSSDLLITPVSRAEYFALPFKTQQSERPVQYYLERTATPVIYFWPTPQTTDWRIKYYALRIAQDVGALNMSPQVANRWLDAVCAGVALRMATKYAPERVQNLTSDYTSAFQFASQEDVEHVTFRAAPDFSSYYE